MIFVIEADQKLRTILVMALELKGHVVLSSGDMDSALKMVSELPSTFSFSCILLKDINDCQLKDLCFQKFGIGPLLISSTRTPGLLDLQDLHHNLSFA